MMPQCIINEKMIIDHKLFFDTERIYDHLTDDLSRQLFSLRTMYSIGQISREQMIEENRVLFEDWKIPEIEDYISDNRTGEMCIFGAGEWGGICYNTLLSAGYGDLNIIFADNNSSLWGEEFQGRPVISPSKLKLEDYKGIVLIANANAFSEIYHQLLFLVDRNQIFVPANGTLIGRRGVQYFDFFEPKENEVFVDCGCLDGSDTIEFVKWCKGDYDFIYGFEPNIIEYKKIENRLYKKGINKFKLYNVACGNHKGTIAFEGDAFVIGHVSADSRYCVECNTIDNLCEGNLTFIKMDIEGEELNAIIGAERSIKNYKPKLAICIYHKPEDVWSIPKEILRIDDTYKFAIRQYWTWPEECVLYAF